MTDTAPAPPPLLIRPDPGTRLEALLSQYGPLKAAAEEAKARYDAVTDAIKAELSGSHQGVRDFTVPGSPAWPDLRLTWRSPWHFDVKRFKHDHPVIYATYAEQKGRWELRAP